MNASGTITGFGELHDRRAVVTGASSGIGRAIALELARAGADVVVHHRRSANAAESVAAEISAMGRRASVLPFDLTHHDAYDDFVEAAWSRFSAPIDIWINNAGADLLTGPDAKLSYSQKLQRLYDVDIYGTALLGRLAGARMKTAGRGVLLNIGWDQADRGMEGDSGELFALSKNAIMGLTRSPAVSLAPEVRVNCIAPGWIKTAWGETASELWHERVLRETPLKRWGAPEDIARLARFLVSDDAAYLTGQVINANGGAVR
ncbi:MAG: SDR family oxidoreductase [Planctomycetaceae bacterium]|nr:SDR family oxidoreductase [Planctomycetaceae bacterium]